MAQETAARTVFRCIEVNRGQTAFMYSKLVAELLYNSPAKARNGLPSTINCVMSPRFPRCGIGETAFD